MSDKVHYRDAFDDLTTGIPRRKYAPDHWLTPVHFAGVRFGARLRAIITRNPLVVWWAGVRNGWGWDG